MSLRQRQWAERQSARLRELLGNKCADCGSSEELEFDVIVAGDNQHHARREWSWRLSYYRQQFELRNLALRCRSCNASKSRKLTLNPDLLDTPF